MEQKRTAQKRIETNLKSFDQNRIEWNTIERDKIEDNNRIERSRKQQKIGIEQGIAK